MDDHHAELLMAELRDTNRYLNRLARVLVMLFGEADEGDEATNPTKQHHFDTGFIEDGVVLPGHNE